MTLNLKKALLAGTAMLTIGALAPLAHAATLTTSADLTDHSYDSGDAGSLDLTVNPTINVDDASTLTFTASIDDNDNGGTANNNVVVISADNGAVVVNTGVTLLQSAGTGDVIATSGDRAGVSVTLTGTAQVAASSNTQDAINLASLTTHSGTINVNSGADVTGKITGGGIADLLAINLGSGGDSNFNGAIDLGAGSDNITIAGTGTAHFQSTVNADTITNNSTGTLDFNGAVTGNIALAADGTVDLAAGVTGTIDNTSGGDGVGTLTTSSGTFSITGAVGGTNSLLAISNTGAGTMTLGSTSHATTITQAGAGQIQFDGATTATTFLVSDASGSLDFNANANGALNFSANGTAELADAITFTGAINNTSGSDGAGKLSLEASAGTTNITGNVGSTNTLASLTLEGNGTTAFGGTVRADLLDYNAHTGTVTLARSASIADVNFNDGDGVLTIADNANLIGSVRDDNADKGTVNFDGTSTVVGSLGTTGAGIKAVNINGTGEQVGVGGDIFALTTTIAGASTLAVSGDITGAVNFTADGTLSLADNATVTGAITTGTINTGNLVLGGDATLATIGTDTHELKTLVLNGTGTTVSAGNTEAAQTTTLNGNLLNITGTLDVDSGQTISTTITDATSIGHIDVSGAATVDADSLLNITVDPSLYVANGQTFTVIDGNAGTGVAQLTNGNITDDSFLLSFTQTSDNQDLVITANRITGSAAATTPNNAALLTVLDTIGAGGDNDVDALQGSLTTASTQGQVNRILEAALPTVDGGAIRAGFDASQKSLEVTGTRLGLVRDGLAGGDTGMSTGQMGKGSYAWTQGFGQQANQDSTDGVAGYEADTYGIAFGMDTQNLMEDVTLGISGSYANSDIDSDNANKTGNDVDSYQVSLYGNLDLSKQAYLEGMLAYAYNDISQTRYAVGGIPGTNAHADYSSNQYIAYAEMGRNYALGAKTTLTPSILANYQHIGVDDYNETGAGGLDLNVNNEDMDVLQFGVGTQLSWNLQGVNGSIIKPAINVGYRYDVLGDNVQATSNFTGAGTSFKTEGFDPAQSTFNAGASITLATHDNWDLSAAYDYEVKSDYEAHSGILRAGYKW